MKLISLSFSEAPRLPSLRPGQVSTIDTDKPNALRHWNIQIRGAAIFLISPPGWTAGRAWNEWDRKGESMIVEVPRVSCALTWSGQTEEIEAMLKKGFETGPLCGPVPDKASEPEAPGAVPIDPKDLGDA